MDLILWRHAQAEDDAPRGGGDLARPLTSRGEQQAAKMAQWLQRRLPHDTRVYCSPALRCQQTAAGLRHACETSEALAPGADPRQLLELAGWPDARHPVLLVGHQPTLGATIARLLQIAPGDCKVRKAAVWWLRAEQHEGSLQASVLAVQSPDLL